MQGKLKKTDAAVKTSEAWWAFIFADGSLGQTIFRWGWPVIGAALGGLIGVITDWVNAYGPVGWALAVFGGILCSLAVVFGVENVRIARLKRKYFFETIEAPQSPDLDSGTFDPPVTAQYVQSAIDEVLAPLQIPAFKKAITNAVTDASATAKEAKRYAEDIGKISQATQDAGIKTLAEHVNKLTLYAEENRRLLHEKVDWISQGFAAVGIWDWHCRNFPPLVSLGKDLTKISEMPVTDELWESWDSTERQWRSDVAKWLQFVSYYAPEAEEKVNAVPDHLYYNGVWQFDAAAFGHPDRVRRYKELAIAVLNLGDCREYVERCIRSAAFEGVGKKGRPSLDEGQ